MFSSNWWANRLILFLVLVLTAGCFSGVSGAEPTRSPEMKTISPAPGAGPSPAPTEIVLPPPRLAGNLSLEEVLARRRSVREFTTQELTMEELGQLLWAAQGITDPAGLRTAPSAGALYPLETYAVTPEGVYGYRPQAHRLVMQLSGDLRDELATAALNQPVVGDAPVVIVIAAVYQRTAQKYGQERGTRYVHLEAGHAAQNILLQAVALDLGGVPIGAFFDGDVQEVLALPSDQMPLYLIPVGHPG